MRPEIFALMILSVLMSAGAQILLKIGMASGRIQQVLADPIVTLLAALRSWPVMAGLMLYGAGALVWLLVLARTDVSMAYPFVGLGIVITGTLGVALLGEPFSVMRAVGTALVIAGVVLVGRS